MAATDDARREREARGVDGSEVSTLEPGDAEFEIELPTWLPPSSLLPKPPPWTPGKPPADKPPWKPPGQVLQSPGLAVRPLTPGEAAAKP